MLFNQIWEGLPELTFYVNIKDAMNEKGVDNSDKPAFHIRHDQMGAGGKVAQKKLLIKVEVSSVPLRLNRGVMFGYTMDRIADKIELP